MSGRIRIGTAGWSIPTRNGPDFPGAGSHLERYAARFDAVEINSSFHRPHRPSTYARWAASVPDDFRFAVKLPKTLTHERRLVDCAGLIDSFAAEIESLGGKLGPVLVQLPPSLIFDASIVTAFFATLHAAINASLVCEPRHASWFESPADMLLADARIARVAADPAKVPAAAVPGGWRGLAYTRLHGSPHIYRSAYEPDAIEKHAETALTAGAQGESWTIYDNTASGAAAGDASALKAQIA
jgi:uncharacterized protein YecE (DUF72 family)